MDGEPFLRGETVTLRTVEEADIPLLQHARSDPEIRTALTFTLPHSRQRVQSFFETVVVEDDSSVNLIVDVDGESAGEANLFNIEQRRGELAYWLLPEFRGNGHASEAVSLLIDHGFDALELHRIYAQTLESNAASQGFLESLGFTLEGQFREHHFMEGRRQDTYYYGLLRSEWDGR